MRSFPDENQMSLSPDSKEPIRGGSVGLNRILSFWVNAAMSDQKPRFSGIAVSAFTFFRNCWSDDKSASVSDIDTKVGHDIALFLDYVDIYMSQVWNHYQAHDGFCPILIYMPDYQFLDKSLLREHTGDKLNLFEKYELYKRRYTDEFVEIKGLERVKCFFSYVGRHSYPHRDVATQFKRFGAINGCSYTSGDPVCLISHIPLDLYLHYHVRNLHLLESYWGTIKTPKDFRLKTVKGDDVPFIPVTHGTFGDDWMIKPMISSVKVKKALLEDASVSKWKSRSPEDIARRIAKIADVPLADLRKFHFI